MIIVHYRITENPSDETCLYYAEPHPLYFMADKSAIPHPTPFLPPEKDFGQSISRPVNLPVMLYAASITTL